MAWSRDVIVFRQDRISAFTGSLIFGLSVAGEMAASIVYG